MQLLARIRAFFWCSKGHLRGRLVPEDHLTDVTCSGPTLRTYECRRCGLTWKRKVYARKEASSAPPPSNQ